MRHLREGLLLALIGAVLPVNGARAADAVLQVGNERGQGSLLRRGNECLIVTPRHVLEDADGEIFLIDPVRVTYADRGQTTAMPLEVFKEDVALLRLAEQPRSGCRDERFDAENLDRLLESSNEGILKRRQVDGSDAFTQVLVTGYNAHDSIRVEPASATKSVDKGDSGSVLYVANRPVGMLTDVENGVGVVMRADKLVATLAPFMAAASRDASLFLSLDPNSAFLENALSREARREGLAVVADADAARLRMSVTSAATRQDSDLGKIVRYATRVEITDALDNLVLEERLEASGNSFVSIESAEANAREALATRLEQAGLLDRLP